MSYLPAFRPLISQYYSRPQRATPAGPCPLLHLVSWLMKQCLSAFKWNKTITVWLLNHRHSNHLTSYYIIGQLLHDVIINVCCTAQRHGSVEIAPCVSSLETTLFHAIMQKQNSIRLLQHYATQFQWVTYQLEQLHAIIRERREIIHNDTKIRAYKDDKVLPHDNLML